MRTELNSVVSPAEAAALFRDLEALPALVLAVSGGPDSTALMWLAARWRGGLAQGPKLIAVTVDHGLRPESAAEARDVARFARTLGVMHRTLRWTGDKPATGLQEAARAARYRLLGDAARKAGAGAIVTAHTLDDQAETVLFRMARGSGIAGLAGMRRVSPLPTAARAPSPLGGEGWGEGARTSHSSRVPLTRTAPRSDLSPLGRGEAAASLFLIRPLLTLPKSRLIATLTGENIAFGDDPSNRDPRFTRPRLRRLMLVLAGEGLDAARLALLAGRAARADAALAAAADAACLALLKREGGRLVIERGAFFALPDEIGLRLLGRAVAEAGDDAPVELGKLEALHAALAAAGDARFGRSLAGALVRLGTQSVTVERAPLRRSQALTSMPSKKRRAAKPR